MTSQSRCFRPLAGWELAQNPHRKEAWECGIMMFEKKQNQGELGLGGKEAADFAISRSIHFIKSTRFVGFAKKT